MLKELHRKLSLNYPFYHLSGALNYLILQKKSMNIFPPESNSGTAKSVDPDQEQSGLGVYCLPRHFVRLFPTFRTVTGKYEEDAQYYFTSVKSE